MIKRSHLLGSLHTDHPITTPTYKQPITRALYRYLLFKKEKATVNPYLFHISLPSSKTSHSPANPVTFRKSLPSAHLGASVVKKA